MASAPELQKKTRSANECWHSSWASWAWGALWNRFDTCSSVLAASWMAPVTRGWQWPSAVTAMPLVKSRYSRPSLSHTRTPSPRTRQIGARL